MCDDILILSLLQRFNKVPEKFNFNGERFEPLGLKRQHNSESL